MLPEALAGATLAALAVPEVLGYARIAGMPVVTGLYTMLAPMVVFAVLCSSRHLVVAADSATAALLLAGLAGLAAAGSPRYVALAGTVALLVAVLLVLARVIGVGFLANFLSRTVLVGFLTGVGITVAIGQLGDLLGVDPGSGDAPERLVQVLSELPRAHLPSVLVGGAVIVSCWRAGGSTGGCRWRCSPWSRRSRPRPCSGSPRSAWRCSARCRRACQGSCCPRSPRPTSPPRSRWPSRWSS